MPLLGKGPALSVATRMGDCTGARRCRCRGDVGSPAAIDRNEFVIFYVNCAGRHLFLNGHRQPRKRTPTLGL
jgi:hypothetical protein